jgi:RNA polymerase sigma-70 factor (ECF subfamily)
MGPGRDLVIREFQRDRFLLLAYIRALVGDPGQAEDIFQSVSVVVLQKTEEFIPGSDLQAWCRGIARNLILRERRLAHRLRSFEDDRILDRIDQAFAEYDQADLLEERRDQMRECMGRLSPSSRELIELRYGSGLSLKQLSVRLRRSEGSIQVALSRIRKWLGECVERHLRQRSAAHL